MELRRDDSDVRKPALEVCQTLKNLSGKVNSSNEGAVRAKNLLIMEWWYVTIHMLQAIYSRDGGQMLKWGHSQVAINTRTASYHDEFKIRLPAILTAQHHLLFTFFHVDLAMKLEAPKPVSSFFFWLHIEAAGLYLCIIFDAFLSLCRATKVWPAS